MLFGKNHPARTGRRRVRAPRQAPERLSVLMQHRSVATKLWHTGCVGGSQSRAADAAVVWGHGRRSERGEHGTIVPVITPQTSAPRTFLAYFDVYTMDATLLRSTRCRLR